MARKRFRPEEIIHKLREAEGEALVHTEGGVEANVPAAVLKNSADDSVAAGSPDIAAAAPQTPDADSIPAGHSEVPFVLNVGNQYAFDLSAPAE